jgi:hypothetical protein
MDSVVTGMMGYEKLKSIKGGKVGFKAYMKELSKKAAEKRTEKAKQRKNEANFGA